MTETGQPGNIDFTPDTDNLYREEAVTDLKVASIRRMIPINPDGTEDGSREPIFMGHTQLMSPEGPLPIQSRLKATTLKDALDEFPSAMKVALAEVVEQITKMRQQQQMQQNNDSRIIVPGR